MATNRRRRVRPQEKSKPSPKPRKRTQKKQKSIQFSSTKLFIWLILILDAVLVYFIVRQCSKPNPQEVAVEYNATPVQVEVLNGCGTPGIASKFTEFLRAKGFDVVKTDNYEQFNIAKTVVIDRRDQVPRALKVIEALGLKPDRLLQEVNEAYLLDVTIIIGDDFRYIPSWKEMESM